MGEVAFYCVDFVDQGTVGAFAQPCANCRFRVFFIRV